MDADLPVAVVGGGPVGLLAANLLAAAGIPCVLLERDPAPFPLPRAAHLDDEALRVFARLGLLEAMAPHIAATPRYELVDAQGRQLLAFDRAAQPLGHPSSVLFHQPAVERVLREAAGAHPLVELRLGSEVRDVREHGAGVTVTVGQPDGRVAALEACAVLACDGAASTVRRRLRIGVRDRGFEQSWLVLDLRLDRPAAHLSVPRQHCDPARPITSVPMSPGRHRFEVRVLPGERGERLADPAVLGPLLAGHLDLDAARIERAAVYTFHALDALHWRDGAVFLLGDAAHQMPPFLGQGLCAGIRDAANLVWKLDLVRRGVAGQRLLDTYELERRPQVATAIRRSMLIGRVISLRAPAAVALRRLLAGLVQRIAPLRRAVGAMRPPPLPRGPLVVGRGPRRRAGQPLPQPPVVLRDGRRIPLDEALGDGFALLGLGADPLAGAEPAVRRAWAAWSARRLLVAPPGAPVPVSPGPAEGVVGVADVTGALTAWGAGAGGDVVVVRPDRVVLGLARRDRPQQLTALTARVTAVLGGPAQGSAGSIQRRS